MPTLNEYFDAVYCINLARRTDRWKHVVEQCKKHTLAVERFDAYADVPDHTGKPNGATSANKRMSQSLGLRIMMPFAVP